MKKSRDRLPERGNGNPYNGYGYGYPQNNGYGYPQDGHQQNNAYQQNNGYGGYQQESYPQNNGYQQQQNNGYNYQQEGYPQNGYPQQQQNGYQQNGYQGGYGGYGYGGYGYPGYGYPGYGGYGYGGYGYLGYGYPGYGGYGYSGYGGYPQMNYIADSYPQEDYGNPYATNEQAQAENGTVTAPQNGAQPNVSAKPTKQTVEKPAQHTASAQEKQEKAALPSETEEHPQKADAAQSEAAHEPAESAQDVAHEGDFSGETDPLRAEAEDLKRKWYAVTAEYENYRKRTANIKQEAYLEGRADIVKKLFPIGDNLDRAIKSCQDETTRKGIEMVLSAFEKLLESENITVIDPLGKPFDPNECEAIMAIDPAEGQESGIVTEVYVKGYAQNDKVLRYAQVIVTK